MSLLLLAALLAGEPAKITLRGSTHALVLSVPMLHALDQWDPTFRPWEERDYQPLIIRFYKFSAFEAPFAIFGDYNGDALIDVAIDGRTKTRTVSIVLLSNSDGTYRVIVVESRRGVIDPKEVWYGLGGDSRGYGLWVFLSRRIPARSELGIVDKVVKPRYESFEREYWEKASSAWYWDGHRFQEVITGD